MIGREQGPVLQHLEAGANSPIVADSTSALMVWRSKGPPDSLRVDARGGWCRFSPDERLIAWANPDGLFVASTDPRAPHTRAQLAGLGADEPRWTRDGRSILYRNATRWYQVPAPTAGLKPAGPPRELFAGNYQQGWVSWELGNDGRVLLLQGQPPLRLTHLNVMTNFPRFLEQMLKAK